MMQVKPRKMEPAKKGSMKKDVIVTIASQLLYEDCEPERVDLITTGRLYRRNGKYFVTYDETEPLGTESSHTTLKLEEQQVTMTRSGCFPAQLMFSTHQQQVGLYETEFGSLSVATHTSQIVNTIGEDGGNLAIDYTVEIDSALAGAHHFWMEVHPSEQPS